MASTASKTPTPRATFTLRWRVNRDFQPVRFVSLDCACVTVSGDELPVDVVHSDDGDSDDRV